MAFSLCSWRFYELGPGTQLKGIMKRIDGKIADKMSNISVWSVNQAVMWTLNSIEWDFTGGLIHYFMVFVTFFHFILKMKHHKHPIHLVYLVRNWSKISQQEVVGQSDQRETIRGHSYPSRFNKVMTDDKNRQNKISVDSAGFFEPAWLSWKLQDIHDRRCVGETKSGEGPKELDATNLFRQDSLFVILWFMKLLSKMIQNGAPHVRVPSET